MAKKTEKRLRLDDDEIKALAEASISNEHTVERKWTFSLFLCCFTMGLASMQFGLNIANLNSATHLVNNFTRNNLFIFTPILNSVTQRNETDIQTSNSSSLFTKYQPLISKKISLNVDEDGFLDVIFTLTNSLFVIGGMIGGFSSKYILDSLGRKKGLLFHNLFSIIGAALVIVSFYIKSPMCILGSRFFMGLQGGMSCTLVPTYLNEISPSNLRGQTGIVFQIFINFGILISQFLGFKEILGNEAGWHFLLALPLIPAVLGFILLFLLFPSSPRELFLVNGDVANAKRALQLFRNDLNVNDELQEIYKESIQPINSDEFTLGKLLSKSEFRWPLITSLVLQISQQLCGINAILYYSTGIFEKANIPKNQIQYAILGTGIVNTLGTLIAVLLIDRAGRKILLLSAVGVIIVDYLALTAFLKFQELFWFFPYLSIACILIFISCFALSLGPIPFLYTAEVFPQNARSTATSLAVLINWLTGLLLTLSFPFLLKLIGQYVFLIFSGIMMITFTVTLIKIPETKGKTPEEILKIFRKQ